LKPTLTDLALNPTHAPRSSDARVAWWRRVLSFQAATVAMLLALVYEKARYDIADPDIWWHLRNAALMLRQHGWIRADSFSWTVNGRPWIDTEWLSEMVYYAGYRIGGLPGVEVVSLLLLGGIMVGIFYLAWRECGNSKPALLAALIVAPMCMVTFAPRTILMGYMLLLGMLVLLQRYRQTGSGPLWLIPPLFCVWINAHGSWSLGLVVFALVIAAGIPQSDVGAIAASPWTAAQKRALCTTFAASVVALLANPYGYRAVLYPLDMALRQKLNIAHVEEWASLDFHTVGGKIVLAIIAALLVSALVRRYRLNFRELALLLFAVYASFTHVRFLFLAAILIAPLLAKLFDVIPVYNPANDRPVLNGAILATVLIGIAWFHPTAAGTEQAVAKEFPAGIVGYWEAHPPQGRVFNFFEWGGFLGWRDAAFRDFVDSRVDLFEYAGIFRDYLAVTAMQHPDRMLDKYGIRYVLFPRDSPVTEALERETGAGGWKVDYADPVCVLLERAGPTPPGTWRADSSPVATPW